MALDDLLMQIGELGRYQWFLFFVAASCATLCPISVFAHVFMMIPVPHWCNVVAWDTSECQGYELDPLECREIHKNMTIPWKEGEGYSQCHMYNVTGIGFGEDNFHGDLDIVECQDGWVFDETVRSLTAKFSLVCGQDVMIRVSQTVFFLGGLFGGLIFGTLSDRFGRVRVWFGSVFLSCVFAVVTLFPGDVWVYTVVRFLNAMPIMVLYSIPFVYVSEIVGCNKRTLVTFAIPLSWSAGYLLITSLAWLIGDWFYIQLYVIGAHLAILPIFIFGILPESPRWLNAKGRLEEAGKVLTMVATRNGKEMPANYQEELLDETKKEEAERETVTKIRPVDLFKNRTMTLWIGVLIIVWFGHGVTYLGLTFLSSELGFAFYPSFFIQAAIEIPAFLFAMVLFAYVPIGRKPPLAFFLIASGVGCIAALFPEPGVWKAVSVFSSKFAISASYVIVGCYSVEVFPTSIRSFGFHLLAIMAQVGSTISPLVVFVAYLWQPFPLVFCSVVTISGGLLLLLVLPESRGTVLPETIEDALALGKSKRRLPTEDYEETYKA